MLGIDVKLKIDELRNCSTESEVVEFKEAKRNFDFSKLGCYFSALSNEANLRKKCRGWLVFGIEDKQHKVVGSEFKNSKAELSKLKFDIANKTVNNTTFIDIHEYIFEAGRVLLFEIPPAPKGIPIPFDGHYYGREGENLIPLGLEKLERIRKQVLVEDWSAETCPKASLDDIDEKAIEKAKENYKIKNPRIAKDIDSWTTEAFLVKNRLLVDGNISRAAILLLGKPEASVHLSPSMAQITWVLYNKDGIERDYQHFPIPFIFAVDEVFVKIRNIKYRYMKEGTLFPEEVDQYDPQNIREALSNCVAHMDYSVGGRIAVAENEDSYLSFVNPGTFLPGRIEEVLHSQEPPEIYRNPLLVSAMVSFNMIDSIGSGIRRMFLSQRERFFPMPDYEMTENKVKMTLIGKIIDPEYTRLLARNQDLSLHEIILLDKIQKKKPITEEEKKVLRKRKLIEGRKPNYFIGKKIAQEMEQKATYSKNKGFEKKYYLDLILKAIKEHGFLNRKDIDDLLWKKLPDWMDEKQRKNKVSNLIYELKSKKIIYNEGTKSNPVWKNKH